MQAPSPSTVTLLVVLPLLAWRAYARFGRMVGKQRLSKIRLWIQLTVFPLLIALLALATLMHPARFVWLAAGLATGAALGVFGLSKTVFEPTPKGLFYTPNAYLGIALSTLFVLRLLYRVIELYVLQTVATPDLRDFARSPPTLAVFGLLAGYYIVYAIGLIRWRWRVLRAKRLREAAQERSP